MPGSQALREHSEKTSAANTPPTQEHHRVHPETLFSGNNLAASLRALGKVQAARDLDQDTLDRKRRILGEDTTPPP